MQAPAPLGASEQVVAGESHQHRALRLTAVDDPAHQPVDIGVFDLAGDQPLEDGKVDRREELADSPTWLPDQWIRSYVLVITANPSAFLHDSFPRSAWECRLRRSASSPIAGSPVGRDGNQRLDPGIVPASSIANVSDR